MDPVCSTYFPSHDDARKYWQRQAEREGHQVGVPNGFPEVLNSSLAWTGSDVEKKKAEWKLDLSADEITAIESALRAFEAKYENNLSMLSSSTFELPAPFSRRLRKLADQLYEGVGFQIVHGLDPSKYTDIQRIIVYAGLSAHICPQRGFVDVAAQSVLAHISNVQAGGTGPQSTAPAFGKTPLSFHTDNCEILAMFYWDTTPTGGRTILSSSWQTYNELAANRPEVLHTLAGDWVLDSFKPYDFQAPRQVSLLQHIDSAKVPFLFRFSRYPVTGWQRKRNPELPQPTKAQLEALDAVQFTAMKNAITLPVLKGDMLFVNDMAVFHAREGFDDGDVPMKRHLVKMFLRDPERGWDIPPSIENSWGKTYGRNESKDACKETWPVVFQLGLQESSKDNG